MRNVGDTELIQKKTGKRSSLINQLEINNDRDTAENRKMNRWES